MPLKKLLCLYTLSFLTTKTLCLECYRSFSEKRGPPILESKFKSFLKFLGEKFASVPGDDLTPPEMIRREGYTAETHMVKTEDGYILTLHRIPGNSNSTAVYLQHGVLGTSEHFVSLGKHKALAYLLADQNYDVWLGNFRESAYSCHESISVEDEQYWNFGWDELGRYDVPAMVNYISNIKKDQIIYAGHSLGTTAFYISASYFTEIRAKVKVMFSIAPVVFASHQKDVPAALAGYTDEFKKVFDFFGKSSFLRLTENHKLLARFACDLTTFQEEACAQILFFFFGYDHKLFNVSMSTQIWNHNPAGTSVKVLAQFGQAISSGKFRQYDYGQSENLKKYGSIEPPDYDLSKIDTPIGLIYAANDFLATIEDVQTLKSILPNVILDYLVPFPDFSHVDFIWGKYAKLLVYDKLINTMNQHK